MRRFALRNGFVCVVGTGIAVLTRVAWANRRVISRVLLLAVLAGGCANYVWRNHTVSSGGFSLYVGWGDVEVSSSRRPPEERLLGCFGNNPTPEMRSIAHAFGTSIAAGHKAGAYEAVRQSVYALRFHPSDWRGAMHAEAGQAFLESGWVDEAEREFRGVVNAIPPRTPETSGSPSRQTAAYGLARTCALRGAYAEAVSWLKRAPDEYYSWCGNAAEAEASENYPEQVVWAMAQQPLPACETELRAVMRGKMTPMPGYLNGDQSEVQRRQAAAEAGLALGCILDGAGRRKEAAACWKLVASRADARFEATVQARRLTAAPPTG